MGTSVGPVMIIASMAPDYKDHLTVKLWCDSYTIGTAHVNTKD